MRIEPAFIGQVGTFQDLAQDPPALVQLDAGVDVEADWNCIINPTEYITRNVEVTVPIVNAGGVIGLAYVEPDFELLEGFLMLHLQPPLEHDVDGLLLEYADGFEVDGNDELAHT